MTLDGTSTPTSAVSTMPTWDGFLVPVLKVLADGQTRKSSEVYKLVADLTDLTPEQRAETISSGQLRLENRIGWALSHLSRCGALFRPVRGRYSITDSGRDIVARFPGGMSERQFRGWLGSEDASSTAVAIRDFLANKTENSSRTPGDALVDAVANTDTTSPATVPDAVPAEPAVSPEEQIQSGIDRIEADVAAELLARLQDSDPTFFEEAVVKLLLAMGYGGAEGRGRRIGGTGDGGVDGVIDQDPLGLDQIYVQAKRYATGNNVGRETIQAFIGALTGRAADSGVFITTSDFSRGARDYAGAIPTHVVLINGKRLTDLMIKYKVGVQVKSTYEVVDIDEDFFE